MEPIDVLKKYFGFNSFRTGQEEIIRSILMGNDTLAIMPTGGGKSICYQIPALILEGTAIVISPLIALMKDQVDALEQKGISATFINSSLSFDELQIRMRKLLEGEFKIVYIAPERLENDFFKRLLNYVKISFLAVDEAHCVSEWGHDFRPAYLNIARALENTNIRPIAAFTATAGAEVQNDIIRYLNMRNVRKFIKGFDRPNLTYHTIETNNKIEKITKILKNTHSGSTIIYCGSRNRVEEIAQKLALYGFPCVSYHAGMQIEHRTDAQNQFLSGNVPVIVATNAFGMGIDKPDVRNVIHCDYTATLEAYYQEAGRAGRDGNPANCYLLHNNQDITLQEFFINNRFPECEDIERTFITLVANSDKSKKVKLPIHELANQAAITESRFAAAVDILEKHEIVKVSRKNLTASIRFLASVDELRNFLQNTTEERRDALTAILKIVSADAFRQSVDLDINRIHREFYINSNILEDTLKTLSILKFIQYTNGSLAGEIELIDTTKSILNTINYNEINERRKIAYSKLNDVVNYAYTSNCKRNYILDYFQDDSYSGTCGKCSSCSSQSRTQMITQKRDYILHTLLKALHENNNRFGKTVFIQLLLGINNKKIQKHNLNESLYFASLQEFSESEIKYVIEYAIARRFIQVSAGLYPILSITSHGLQFINKDTTDSEKNDEFMHKLKNIRQKIAKLEGITERSVASDKALRIIAHNPNISYSEFLKVPGISKYIIEKYGKEFYLSISDSNSIDNIDNSVDENIHNISQLFKSGKSIHEIAEIYKTDKGTIARITQDAIMNGKIELDWKLFTNDKLFQKIKQIIYKKPSITLSRLRQLIVEDIDYAVLRIIVAIARKSID